MNTYVYFYGSNGVFVGARVNVCEAAPSVAVEGDELEALLDSIDMIPVEYDATKAFKMPVVSDGVSLSGWFYQTDDDNKSLSRFYGVCEQASSPRMVADDDLIDFCDSIGKWPTDDEE